MTNKEKFIEQLKTCSKAWGKASEIWANMDNDENHDLDKNYPFKDSFDDMYYNFIAWIDDLEEKEVPKFRKFRVGVYEVWEQMYEVEAVSEEDAMDKIAMQEDESICFEDQFTFVELDDDPYHFYEIKE